MNLNNDNYEVIKPILVEIDKTPGDCVARMIGTDAVGFGVTPLGAKEALKDNIVMLYEDMVDDKDNLGIMPKRWLNVLKRHIRRK